MGSTTTDPFELLVAIALDLNASLTASDRYQRLVEAARRALPCDAAVLLRLRGNELIPLAAHGLVPDALGRRFPRNEHPRLDILCNEDGPTLFPPDSPLPDPFDGLLADAPGALDEIHACLGCPLRVDGELVGVLTLDALEPGAFDAIAPRFLVALGELAGAALRTSELIVELERRAERGTRIAHDLEREMQDRRGGHMIGESEAIRRLRREVDLVARSGLGVLVTGETGVGKELVARRLHAESPRATEPLIYVNCAALPESMAESELFGHVRGAFTGAQGDRAGKFEVADGGTLFLDEVGELPLSIQPKLLRALQEGEIQRVGSDQLLHVDVRVVAATNRRLEEEVAAGRFRADLFHRLDVYRVHVPALREHPEDVAPLAGHFCDSARRQLGLGPVRLSADARATLAMFPWPGNVRELEHVIARAVLRASADVERGEPVLVRPEHLGQEFGMSASPPKATEELAASTPMGASLREDVDDFQRARIRKALESSEGNWAAAARALGLHRSNLHHLARRLGLR